MREFFNKKMKKIALILGFIAFSLNAVAFTESEIIQYDLKKLSVKQEIINETINADAQIGDKILAGQGQQFMPYLENLYKKDIKNFVVADMINNHYTLFDKSKYIKNKKMIDNYIKYVPYDYEKLSAEYNYNNVTGNTAKAQQVLNKIKSLKKNDWASIWLSLNQNDSTQATRLKVRQVVEKMEVAKNDISNGISDEDFYYMKVVYNNLVLRELTEKQDLQTAIDYYVEYVGNENISENLIKRYSTVLTNQFNEVVAINQNIIKRNADINEQRLVNTRIYKVLTGK